MRQTFLRFRLANCRLRKPLPSKKIIVMRVHDFLIRRPGSRQGTSNLESSSGIDRKAGGHIQLCTRLLYSKNHTAITQWGSFLLINVAQSLMKMAISNTRFAFLYTYSNRQWHNIPRTYVVYRSCTSPNEYYEFWTPLIHHALSSPRL